MHGGNSVDTAIESSAPEDVLRVVNGVELLKLSQFARIFNVNPAYYTWDLKERQKCLNAPSEHHLCKTVVFENTKWREDLDPADPSTARYIMVFSSLIAENKVIVQYTDKINSQKLNNYVRSLNPTPRPRKYFNMRVTAPETALEITGYAPGMIF